MFCKRSILFALLTLLFNLPLFSFQEGNSKGTIKAGLTDSVFNKGNEQDVFGLISGLAPGVLISKTGADPNKAHEARIRGIGTVLGNQNPLIVIDGLRMASINMIDLNDIESVRIISGPETAKYGMLGANGVLEIKTKAFSDQPLQVNFYQSVFLESAVYKQKVLDREAYLALGANDLGDDTDWIDFITQNAVSSLSNLSVNGASGKFQYLASANLRLVNGILKESGFDKHNFFGKVRWTPSENMNMNYSSSYTGNEAELGFGDAFKHAYRMNPSQPIYFNNGGIYDAIAFEYVNPANYLFEASRRLKETLFTQNLNIEKKVGQSIISFQGNYLSEVGSNTEEYSPDFLFGESVENSETSAYETNQYNVGLSYVGGLKELGSLNLKESFSAGLFNRNLATRQRSISDGSFVDVNDEDELNIYHVDFSLDADFRQFISAQLYLRYEKSSTLGEDTGGALFPSITAQFALGEKIEKLRGLDFNLGYGVSGLTLFDDDYNKAGSENPLGLNTVNSNLTFEKSTNTEIGASYMPQSGIWQFGVTRFSRLSSDLMGVGIGVSGTGLSAPGQLTNSSEIQNSGWELNADLHLKADRFRFTSSLSFSTLNTEWKEHPFSGSSIGFIELRNPLISISQIGEAYGALRGYKATLINNNIVFLDATGDGAINQDDILPIGQPLPSQWLGWRNSIEFSKTKISTLVEGSFGHSILNSRSYLQGMNDIDGSIYNILATGFQFNDFPIFPSDIFIEKASYVRLRYIAIDQMFTVQGFNFTAFIVANNLFTITDFTGNDPSPRLSDPFNREPYYVNLPGFQRTIDWLPSRSFMLGVKLQF